MSEFQEDLDVITPRTNIFALLEKIMTACLNAVDSENGSLLLLDEGSGELVFVEVQSPLKDQLIGFRLPPKEGVAGYVASTRKPLLVREVQKDPRFSSRVDETFGFKTASLICAPLTYGRRTLGVIEAVNTRSGAPFNDHDLDIMLLVSRLAAVALTRADDGSPAKPVSPLS
jgi:adenylate cyclase